MRIRRMLFPLLAVVAISACAGEAGQAGDTGRTETERPGSLATHDPATVRTAIDSVNKGVIDAFTKGDPTALAAHYESDAIVMAPNGPAWKGRSGIEESAKGMFGQAAIKDMKLETDDLVVSGDLAVETGRYSMTVEPKGGKAAPDKGKYLVVWRRQADGSWKIHRDIWNTDTEMK